MPPHSLSASLGHLIQSGLDNCTRLLADGRNDKLSHELMHLTLVCRYLERHETDHLTEGLDSYWDLERPAYISGADPDCIRNHHVAWKFLVDASIRGDSLREDLHENLWREYLRFSGGAGRPGGA